MLPWKEDVEIHALKKRGWSINRIARHTGRDRKTVRAYLNGERVPGERRRAEPDAFERFEPCVRSRLAEDPHLWALTLFDGLEDLGYDRSYQTLTRHIRFRDLRPGSEPGERSSATRPSRPRYSTDCYTAPSY